MSKAKAPQIRHVVFDADNTLWDWAGMHLPAIQAMAKFMAKQTRTNPEKVIASMRRVYSRAGSLDHTPLVQEMDLFRDMPKKSLIDLVISVRDVYGYICDRNFHLYPGTREVLRALKKGGIKTHIITDAPLLKTQHRVDWIGIGGYISTIFGQQDSMMKLLPSYTEARALRWSDNPPYAFAELLQHKPEIDLTNLLKLSHKAVRQSVMVVGDDLVKDMGMARHNQCLGCYAEYGRINPEQMEQLKHFGAREEALRGVRLNQNAVDLIQNTRIKVLKRISDLLKYIDGD